MSTETLLILFGAAVLGLLFWLGLRRAENSLRQELQVGVRGQLEPLHRQLSSLVTSLNQQVGDVRTALQSGLADTGKLASEAQKAVAESLSRTTTVIGDLKKQLGGIEEAGRELSQATRTLETVLSSARTRGTLGEVALERLLGDTLPQSAYELQYRFRSGAFVDAALHFGEKILPVDSKFPLEAYRRLAEAEDEQGKAQARKEFATAVRKHADDIAEKYILPQEDTLELALMFLASEGVYYELLLTADNKGTLAEYCRSQRVVPVSPNTLYAYLAVILMGLRGMQVEENARRLLSSLSGLQVEVEAFAEVHARLGTHLKNASQSYAEAAPKLEQLERSVSTLAEGKLPPALEPELTERPNK
jgi:DNA recombination protein RmuC